MSCLQEGRRLYCPVLALCVATQRYVNCTLRVRGPLRDGDELPKVAVGPYSELSCTLRGGRGGFLALLALDSWYGYRKVCQLLYHLPNAPSPEQIQCTEGS